MDEQPYIPEIINLKNFTVIKFTETELDYYITVKTTTEPICCQSCGIIREHALSRYGKREFIYMDIPISAKRVGIKVVRQRYKCHECSATFFEDLTDMDDSHRATKRLVKYIQEQALEKPFLEVADDIGVDEKTIRRIFKEYAEEFFNHYHRVIPNWVGFDEIHLHGKPRFVFTNLENHTLIDMLENRTKDILVPYFFRMKDKHNIKIVAMDMWYPYRDIVHEVLPWAVIVVDKYHILAKVNDAVQKVRKHLRSQAIDKQKKKFIHSKDLLNKRKRSLDKDDLEKLEAWLNAFPILSDAYYLKEMLYDIWGQAKSKQEALTLFDEWTTLITDDVYFAFEEVLGTFKNWREEIFNYFDYPYITNALTESLNNLIRDANRKGRGYYFNAIRIKAVMTWNQPREEKPKFDKQGFKEGMYLRVNDSMRLDYYLRSNQPIPSYLEYLLIKRYQP